MQHAMKQLFLPVLLALALPTAALADPGPLPIAKDATPTLCGDANCDGQVDFSDSIRILQYLGNREKYSLSETGLANADVDGNAGVTANDARCIQMFVAGLLPDLGGQSSIGTPNADLGPVRLMMRGDGGQDRMTVHPGETINVNVYVERTDMKLGGIFLRVGGQLPPGVMVSMEDYYVYALYEIKEFSQMGDYYVCDALQQYGEPQEVDFSEPIGQFELYLPADLKPDAYEISPIAFCQLFEDGTSHIFDVSYSPLWLMVHEPISYSDPTDAAHQRKYCADYTFYNGEHTLASGWWVVAGANTSIARIDVSGDVNILLMDGAELTAAQGFHVTGTNRLTVWAQSGGRTRAGRLNVTSPENCSAGIGGNDGEAGGTVTVNGGVLEIAGGYKSAAIGGGQSGAGGMSTVNGGFVTATGGQYGTGIGGGMAMNANYTGGSVGAVTINGGEVTANGGEWGAGIGGGAGTSSANGSSGGTVTINGGTVTATGGVSGAGIGGGRYAGGVAVEIRGGTVTTVSGGGAHAIGEGNGWTGEAGRLAIDGMKVFASASATEPVAPEERESVCCGEWAKLVACTHEYDTQGVCTLCGSDAGPVPYLDPTDADSPGKVCEVPSAFTGQAGLTNGWYVARGAVQAEARVEVVGSVHLVLCDGAEVTAARGFHVTGTNSLVVWAQSGDRATAGKLNVTSPENCFAGIGGNAEEAGGTVTVNGGVLEIAGSYKSAAIGGGRSGAGGTTTINGGFVTATGGEWGTGLGGGMAAGSGNISGNAGRITVNGGEVTATGGSWGPGIGGAGGQNENNGSSGGSVVINGGTVTATGGSWSAGIGGGRYAGGVAVEIRGGTVTAVSGGGSHAIGEGNGWTGEAGSLAIDGMRVFAGAGAAEAVAAAEREATCRSAWAKVEPCPHGGVSGVCPWCGLVEAWARGYVDWAGANGVAGAWNEKDAGGVANVFRYLFGKAAGTEGLDIVDLRLDEEGRTVVVTSPLVNTQGFSCAVIAADTPDWPDPVASHPLDPDGETTIDEADTGSRSRFYRLKAVPAE